MRQHLCRLVEGENPMTDMYSKIALPCTVLGGRGPAMHLASAVHRFPVVASRCEVVDEVLHQALYVRLKPNCVPGCRECGRISRGGGSGG
jgi:hypothetical protein